MTPNLQRYQKRLGTPVRLHLVKADDLVRIEQPSSPSWPWWAWLAIGGMVVLGFVMWAMILTMGVTP